MESLGCVKKIYVCIDGNTVFYQFQPKLQGIVVMSYDTHLFPIKKNDCIYTMPGVIIK